MGRLSKFEKLVSLAESEERRCGVIAGESQSYVGDQSAKLNDLSNYRQAYANKPLPGGSVSAQHWSDYHRFLQKLDQAIDAQRQIVCDGERNLELHRKQWLKKRQKRESLQNMKDKADKRQHLRRERIEQKQQDELSTSSFSRRLKAD